MKAVSYNELHSIHPVFIYFHYHFNSLRLIDKNLRFITIDRQEST